MFEKISSSIIVPEKCPQIILGVGPCRSATTASLRLFAQNDIPSFYQPIKSILREQVAGREMTFSIPTNSDILYIKDPIGPFTEEESQLNPLEVLRNAGVPKEKIKLLTLMREPLATMTSWVDNFSFYTDKDKLVDNLISAYKTVDKMRKVATQEGIKSTSFVYESLRDNNSELVIQSLNRGLDIPTSLSDSSDWRNLPEMGTPESNIWIPELSNKNFYSTSTTNRKRAHEKLESSSGFQYHPKDTDQVDDLITINDTKRLQDSGLFAIYNDVRVSCMQDLCITVKDSSELIMFNQRHGIVSEISSEGSINRFRGKER